MKALKSSLAEKVLADESARNDLRKFLQMKSNHLDSHQNQSAFITITADGRSRKYRPMVVAKAS